MFGKKSIPTEDLTETAEFVLKNSYFELNSTGNPLMPGFHKKKSHILKGATLGLRQFLATERPLKMMKNDFYFTLNAVFVLKIFKFLS